MASPDPPYTSPPAIFQPRIRDGMIVVRRPATTNDATIFWAGNYFFPKGTNEAIGMDYPAFLADLEAHFQYNPELDEIQFHVPSPYRNIDLDPSRPRVRDIQSLQPTVGIVRTYNEWLAALWAMQSSRLMRVSNIEYVLRNGMVTSSVHHRIRPVAAAQFFIVRTSDAEDSNQEGDDNSGQV
ncbi:hypothetical protein N7519_011574 [Penicillium mononematosum]|uniref:uncharacterized protein n=1 Tax=Penicillium mononematosum TaxID=268346 RepID=UPI002548C031|nr:uncharacterized protein N7519_011574 [Penicillium mononematosum]KAJ6181113.1 hypothetical protein N7519_011574 [Penicillium mononematosum]